MQLHVESIHAGFPDCIARQRVGGKEQCVRIEFEYRSSNFRAHGHPVDGCDWIVCWEHDWPTASAHIKVVELREYFGYGFNVWVLSCEPWDERPAKHKYYFQQRVAKGDLVLIYETSPRRSYRFVYAVADRGTVHKVVCNGKISTSHVHTIRRICTLQPALHANVLEADRLIPAGAIYHGKVTEHWWRIHALLLQRYPNCRAALGRFCPSQI
jgi:hypothetical protein